MKEEILKEFFIASFYAMCHLRGHGMPAAIFRKFWDLQECKECTFRNFEQMDLIFVFFCSIIILNGLFNFTIHQHLTLEYTFRETYCIFFIPSPPPLQFLLGPSPAMLLVHYEGSYFSVSALASQLSCHLYSCHSSIFKEQFMVGLSVRSEGPISISGLWLYK